MNINAVLDGNPVKIVDINRVGSSAYVAFINAGGQLVSNVYHTSAFDVANISLSTSAINVPDDYSVSAVGPIASTPGLSPTISLLGATGDASSWTLTADVGFAGNVGFYGKTPVAQTTLDLFNLYIPNPVLETDAHIQYLTDLITQLNTLLETLGNSESNGLGLVGIS